MNRKMLDGKVIIVVGASGGLGKVFATEFAREGAIVVMTGRNEEKLRQAAAEVAEETGGRTFPVQADYKDKEDCDRLFDTVLAEFGTFDGLVTNASSTGEQLSLEATDEAYVDEIIDTDVKGLIRYNRRALQHFLEKDSGCILNIGSNNLQHPICDSVYCAAKYAMYGLSKQLAMRCVGTGVRVNILNPGSFPSASGANATTFADVDTSHLYDAGELVQASGRIPVPNGSMIPIMKARTNRAVPVHLEQVAYAAVYLLSDLATDVQGQMFTVDRGGYL